MTYIITSPLYYVNDKPHLGSTYTTIACDTLARFKRLEGINVIFITGVDEHGQKIQNTAEARNISPKTHCDQIAQTYRNLWSALDISNDRFVRTTDQFHYDLVCQFFERCKSNGDIYMGRQKGWYCVGCEEYKEYPESELNPKCDIHKKELEWRDEENLFFRLSNYQEQIEELISQANYIQPASRRNEIINFVRTGLKDFSISRVSVSWGLSVPGYQNHTFYVWFDALLGYLTGLISGDSSTNIENVSIHGWPNCLHIIGKDILRFHSIYWPAMLISGGFKPPSKIFGHGFLTREGIKMGKTLGNILDPIELLNSYGNDSVRWYLLREFKFGQDGDFQKQRFLDIVNNDLANTIGNLLNRTTSMSRKWFNNSTPYKTSQEYKENKLYSSSLASIAQVRKAIELLEFNTAAENILLLATTANIYLNENKPWSLIKIDQSRDKVAYDIYIVLESTRIVATLLYPILPDLSKRILGQLNLESEIREWSDYLVWGRLGFDQALPNPEPVFEKIEDKEFL